MKSSLQQLEAIQHKINRLLQQNKELNTANNQLKEENFMLKKLLKEKDEMLIENENQLQMLKLAKSVSASSNEQDKIELKKKINELIKEIDHCVGLLNN
jgi:predicted  nucleic acid-binding Zn-ribbon protein